MAVYNFGFETSTIAFWHVVVCSPNGCGRCTMHVSIMSAKIHRCCVLLGVLDALSVLPISSTLSVAFQSNFLNFSSPV